MSSQTVPPKESFKLSMLLYDTRYRSLTFQVIALIAFMTLIFWLISNTNQNLEELGKEPSFRFLWEPAGYDIGQYLIYYINQHPHFRAAIVGLLNTLLIAVLGCITATVLGVIIGVLRLSKNWIVSRIMAVYVEMFRNVPVLLWIVLIMAILIETLPSVRGFRGPDPVTDMSFFGTVAFSNKGVFIPRLMMTNLGWLVFLTFVASLFVIQWLRKRANRIQSQTGIRPAVLWPAIGVLIVPSVIVFFATSLITNKTEYTFVGAGDAAFTSVANFAEANKINYCHSKGQAHSLNGLEHTAGQVERFSRKEYFSLYAAEQAFRDERCNLIAVPANAADEFVADMTGNVLGGALAFKMSDTFMNGNSIQIETPVVSEKGIAKFFGGTHLRNAFIALWLALSLYTAAFIAEIVRSGILAVSKGQTEAANALGMRPNRTMSLIVLPQALRVIIPPLISNYLNLTKNSSLAIAVGYMDLTGTLMGITLNQTGRELETVLLTMLIYLTISLAISGAMNLYNNKVKLVER